MIIPEGRLETKLRAGGYYHKTVIEVRDGRMVFNFDYDKDLLKEVKESFEERKWHPESKVWSAPITYRNLFQLNVLMGKYGHDPYKRFEQRSVSLEDVEHYCQIIRHLRVKLYNHQLDMVSHGVSNKWFIWAAEMGTGKTLAAIIALEMLPAHLKRTIFWVGPNSALTAARVEFMKWKCYLNAEFYTYDALRTLVRKWKDGLPAPTALILDESSKCKTPTAQRTVAARHIADSMREEYGEDCVIGLLSGSPAPKSPPDWWAQCEIACPGFLREQNIQVFRMRMGIFAKEESDTGSYNKLVTWKDSTDKCETCGKPKDDPVHDEALSFLGEACVFKPIVNEVTLLAKRLQGLVLVKLKKDCLDLPPLRYHVKRVEPSQEVLNAAKIVVQSSRRAVDALIKLRTLSDGFFYRDEPTGEFDACPGCGGSGQQTEYVDPDSPYDALLPDEISGNCRFVFDTCPDGEDPLEYTPKIIGKRECRIEQQSITCFHCGGEGRIERLIRTLDEVTCPKDDYLFELLEAHEECGRFNIYAGFQGSLDRVIKMCHTKGWSTFKADGRGWGFRSPTGQTYSMSKEEMLLTFDQGQEDFPRLAFVGQPGAAGMGLTLTASPGTFFFSNDFTPENRMQAEHRGHRIGMDIERGGQIYDVINLPSDEKVLNALKQSKKLQHMSLTGLQELFT